MAFLPPTGTHPGTSLPVTSRKTGGTASPNNSRFPSGPADTLNPTGKMNHPLERFLMETMNTSLASIAVVLFVGLCFFLMVRIGASRGWLIWGSLLTTLAGVSSALTVWIEPGTGLDGLRQTGNVLMVVSALIAALSVAWTLVTVLRRRTEA